MNKQLVRVQKVDICMNDYFIHRSHNLYEFEPRARFTDYTEYPNYSQLVVAWLLSLNFGLFC